VSFNTDNRRSIYYKRVDVDVGVDVGVGVGVGVDTQQFILCCHIERDCPRTTHRWMSARNSLEVLKISADDRRSSGNTSSGSGSGSVTATFQCRLCNESSIKKEKQQQQPYKPPNTTSDCLLLDV